MPLARRPRWEPDEHHNHKHRCGGALGDSNHETTTATRSSGCYRRNWPKRQISSSTAEGDIDEDGEPRDKPRQLQQHGCREAGDSYAWFCNGWC